MDQELCGQRLDKSRYLLNLNPIRLKTFYIKNTILPDATNIRVDVYVVMSIGMVSHV